MRTNTARVSLFRPAATNQHVNILVPAHGTGDTKRMQATATALYPFVPSGPDFKTAIAFFHAIGFSTVWEQDSLAGLRYGKAYFLLQNIDVPEWQSNQMITFEVDDLNVYWTELSAQDLEQRFAGVKIKAPVDYPRGREIHIIDPGGVCWHVRNGNQS